MGTIEIITVYKFRTVPISTNLVQFEDLAIMTTVNYLSQQLCYKTQYIFEIVQFGGFTQTVIILKFGHVVHHECILQHAEFKGIEYF